MVSDCYQDSCQAIAGIVNAALEDMGVWNDLNMLNQKKVTRVKVQIGMEMSCAARWKFKYCLH